MKAVCDVFPEAILIGSPCHLEQVLRKFTISSEITRTVVGESNENNSSQMDFSTVIFQLKSFSWQENKNAADYIS